MKLPVLAVLTALTVLTNLIALNLLYQKRLLKYQNQRRFHKKKFKTFDIFKIKEDLIR